MFEFIKTKVYDSLLISSVVTVLEVDLRKKESEGEVHNFPEIIYIKDGYTDLYVDGSIVNLKKGQLIIIAPNTYHGKPDSPPELGTGVHTIISFESSSLILKELYNTPITLNEEQIGQYLKISNLGLNIFEFAQTENNVGGMKPKSSVLPYELEALKKQLELFLIELYHTNVAGNTSKPSHAVISSLNDYLYENITQNITVEEMSRRVCVSPTILRKYVHEHYGCGPHQHFINIKINEAKHLIKSGNMNFTEISEYLGFETIHYFSRQFKNRVGKSPREFLKDITDTNV